MRVLAKTLEADYSAGASLEVQSKTRSQRQALCLVFGCTVLGAAAQILMKAAANHTASADLMALFTNLPLLVGYSLYGLSTLLLILALREGELSLLYPVIALTYVWVTALSVLIFHERINLFKLAGIVVLVVGVAVLGKAQEK